MRLILILLSLLLCDFCHSQWQPTSGSTGDSVFCFTFKGNTLFAGTLSGVYRSTNNGANWTPANIGLTNPVVRALAVNGTDLFAGTSSGVIFRSTDDGANWNAIQTTGLPGSRVEDFAAIGGTLFTGTYGGGGVYRSTDNGATWTLANTGLSETRVTSLFVIDTKLIAGTWGGGGIYRSTDNGTTWTAATGLGLSKEVEVIGGSPTSLFSVTNSGVYRSTDEGLNWTYSNNSDSGASSVFVSGSAVFLGTSWGVTRSTDNGATWTYVNVGLPLTTKVRALSASSSHLLAAILTEGIWRRPLAEMGVNSVEEIRDNRIPAGFGLEQNYPNPFNPTTTFQFSIPSAAFVTLKIFNLLGVEVGTLVSEELSRGIFRTRWDASGLTSGVYFFRLTADGLTQTKRMLLLR